MAGAYYNEFDPFAAEWIRQLIKKKLIADGDVDDRSIKEVSAADLRGYRQCHFFAGIGVWQFALRGAGWSDTREVWTGSCPCQSFSHAGQRKGFEDSRNLWPEWIRLIRECAPPVLFGEQVSAAVKHGWLDIVQTDLETEGYAVGKAVLGACSVGAPHIRQRLYFVAKSESAGTRQDERRVRTGVESSGAVDGLAYSKNQRLFGRRTGEAFDGTKQSKRLRDAGELANTTRSEQQKNSAEKGRSRRAQVQSGGGRVPGRMDNANGSGLEGHAGDGDDRNQSGWFGEESVGSLGSAGSAHQNRFPGPTNGFWRDVDWLSCTDGKWRPVEPGTFPLVARATSRMGRLRGFGNALNAETAKAFIAACMEIL
jgi:DNA (cytosine-5)-methyltransferase 1